MMRKREEDRGAGAKKSDLKVCMKTERVGGGRGRRGQREKGKGVAGEQTSSILRPVVLER